MSDRASEAEVRVLALAPAGKRRPASVELADGTTLEIPEEIALRYGVREGAAFAPDAWRRIAGEAATVRARDAALASLGRRGRSRAELERELGKKGHPPAAVGAALDRLAEMGLLDDARAARDAAQAEIRMRPVGRRLLEQKLRRRGFASAVIDEVVAETLGGSAGAEEAVRAARGYLRRRPGADRPRLARHLASRGFSWDEIDQAVQSALEDPGDPT